jgi:hypothetical protein
LPDRHQVPLRFRSPSLSRYDGNNPISTPAHPSLCHSYRCFHMCRVCVCVCVVFVIAFGEANPTQTLHSSILQLLPNRRAPSVVQPSSSDDNQHVVPPTSCRGVVMSRCSMSNPASHCCIQTNVVGPSCCPPSRPPSRQTPLCPP